MELFQIFWDDHNKLFLEFKKNQEEQLLFVPEKIKRLILQFEISKQEFHQNQPPYLIAIKRLYHSSETLSFSIELDELINTEGLLIKILRLSIFLYSGRRFQYFFEEAFKISDIWINDDCYNGFELEDLQLKKRIKGKITQEKIFQEIKTSIHENKEERTLLYQKSKIEKSSEEDSLALLISEGNKTLKRIENALQNLSLSFQNMPNTNIQYIPPIPGKRDSEPGIERIKLPKKPAFIQGQISSNKLMVIKEMKSIFKENIEKNTEFNIKAILKPLSEEELKAIMLNDEELIKKEEKAIKNQIKRLKKQKDKEIHLEKLKPPK
ncbi:MAG: hypothetical protein ACFE9Q_06400 [Candidatus Hodarchaeota archaeon]